MCLSNSFQYFSFLEEVTKMMLEDDLLIKIHKLLENDKATPEILFNSISLLETLLKTGISRFILTILMSDKA